MPNTAADRSTLIREQVRALAHLDMLKEHADRAGKPVRTPSPRTLAKRLGCDVATARQVLTGLSLMGLLP